MKMMKFRLLIVCISFIVVTSCNNNGRGYEYMPNMYRSPSLETYGLNNVLKDSLNARMPVEGTIARGYLKTFNYGPSLEEYLLAGEEVVNPFERNIRNIDQGKDLYGMFCKHCHGIEGAGGGTVQHPLYSAIPHYNDNNQQRRSGSTMSKLMPGHIFHAITYGLNAMGPHSSQLTEEERWKIVLYVQELQAIKKEK
tara:strand:- start:10396 stop:10983 length:588 start_codon:yes stop_codon:yes gene_type:complete